MSLQFLEGKGLVIKIETWLGKPHVIKHLKKNFGKHMQDVQSHKSPGTPKL